MRSPRKRVMAETIHPRLPRPEVIEDRTDFISAYCRDKTVLHLGCIGNLETFETGSALHLHLMKRAKRVIGVDINRDAIEHLSRRGISDLICFDVTQLDRLDLEGPIDVIVAGEILEHLSNPGLCLGALSEVMRRKRAILIVTVPNAFSTRHFLGVLLAGRELVRPDHCCYFSYSTLKELLGRHNLQVVEYYAYSQIRQGMVWWKRIIKMVLNRTVLRISPFAAEGLVAIATPGVVGDTSKV